MRRALGAAGPQPGMPVGFAAPGESEHGRSAPTNTLVRTNALPGPSHPWPDHAPPVLSAPPQPDPQESDPNAPARVHVRRTAPRQGR